MLFKFVILYMPSPLNKEENLSKENKRSYFFLAVLKENIAAILYSARTASLHIVHDHYLNLRHSSPIKLAIMHV